MKLPAPSSDYDAGNEAQTRRAIEQEDTRNLKHSSGFWTPTLFGTTTPGSPTYVRQEGWWTRVDDMIIAPFRVEISAIGGMAGNLGLGGSLPVSPVTLASGLGGANGGGFLHEVTGLTHQAGRTQWGLQMRSGTADAQVTEFGSAVASTVQTIVNMASATVLSGVLIYKVRL
jgi:hypothetical protein